MSEQNETRFGRRLEYQEMNEVELNNGYLNESMNMLTNSRADHITR